LLLLFQVCGAVWTDYLISATCHSAHYAQAYARDVHALHRDYRCAHLRMAHIQCITNGEYKIQDTVYRAQDDQYCNQMFNPSNICPNCAV
jgi:hypothetical protein